jgi:hypothetical protein
MQESPKRNQETRLQTQSKTLRTQGENSSQTKDSATRIKKMRAWLGVKGSANFTNNDENDEPLYYGDGHSGWNR